MYGICARRAIVACVIACAMGSTMPAAAQETPEERAIELYRQSEAEYQAGRFGHAAELLSEAYRVHPDPNLLYNLARAHEGAGDLEAAIDAYTAFLEASEGAEDRPAIERRIDTLRYQLAEREGLEEDRKQAVEERVRAERRAHEAELERVEATRTGIAPWVLGGAGLLAIAGGTVLGALALERHGDAAGAGQDHDLLHAEAATLGDIAIVSLVTGAVLVAAGATWLAIDLSNEPPLAVRF